MRRELYPVQPFFVNNTTKYYKKVMPQTPYVHFYAFTVDAVSESLSAAIPDGCADILFTVNKERAEGHVYGYVTKFDALSLPRGTQCFGVRFRPGYLPSRLGISLPEIANTRVSMDSLPGGTELVENIAKIGTGQGSFLKKTELLQNYVGDQWRCNSLLLQFIEVMEHADTVRVGKLEKQTLYSARYINRIFNDNLGLSPKTFAKCIRFQRLINAMNNEDSSCLSELAASFGYFDQSHFYKEFKELAAITPGEYQNAVDITNYKQKFVYV